MPISTAVYDLQIRKYGMPTIFNVIVGFTGAAHKRNTKRGTLNNSRRSETEATAAAQRNQ
jgi:hypothetical protein